MGQISMVSEVSTNDTTNDGENGNDNASIINEDNNGTPSSVVTVKSSNSPISINIDNDNDDNDDEIMYNLNKKNRENNTSKRLHKISITAPSASELINICKKKKEMMVPNPIRT